MPILAARMLATRPMLEMPNVAGVRGMESSRADHLIMSRHTKKIMLALHSGKKWASVLGRSGLKEQKTKDIGL